MKKTLIATMAAIAMGATAFTAPVANAAEVTLKLVTMLPLSTPIGRTFDAFMKRLNAEMKGEFQIDHRGGPEVIKQFKQPNAVRLGSVDMTLTSPSYANGILNVSGTANYSNKQYAEIKATGYHDYMTELHKAKGLVYIGELPVSQLRFHIFLKEPIKKLEDFKGLKIRVFPAIRPAMAALGANPVVLPMPAIYTSMERGVVQGFVTGVSGVAEQYKGVVGAYVEPGFYRATFHFLANPKSWAKVPAATQAKVINFVRTADAATYEASWNANLKAGYETIMKEGIKKVEFTGAEREKFLQLVNEAPWMDIKKKAPMEAEKLKMMLMK